MKCHDTAPKDAGEIQPITLDDLDILVELHGEYLNYGEGVRPHFERVLRQESAIALKYVIGDAIAGVIIFTEGVTLSGDHDALEQKLRRMAKGKKVYTGDAVLVRHRYRRRGISTAMLKKGIGMARARGAHFMLHELWVLPNGTVPAAGHVNVYDWAYYLGCHRDFYRNFSHYGYGCPLCGSDCACSAQIFLCSLDGEESL